MKGFVILTTLMALLPLGFANTNYNKVPNDANDMAVHVIASCRSSGTSPLHYVLNLMPEQNDLGQIYNLGQHVASNTRGYVIYEESLISSIITVSDEGQVVIKLKGTETLNEKYLITLQMNSIRTKQITLPWVSEDVAAELFVPEYNPTSHWKKFYDMSCQISLRIL